MSNRPEKYQCGVAVPAFVDEGVSNSRCQTQGKLDTIGNDRLRTVVGCNGVSNTLTETVGEQKNSPVKRLPLPINKLNNDKKRKMNNTIILFISLMLNILFLAMATIFIQKKGGLLYLLTKIFKTVNTQKLYSKNYDNPTYLNKKSQFEILPKSNSAIIFLGDSLTDEGEWTELLGNSHIKKRGISGDTTDRILNRLDAIVESKPKKILLMVGINDLIVDGKSLEEILEFSKKILTNFRNQIPDTQVLIQSVLPVNNTVTRYWQNNNNVLQLNSHLRDLANEYTYQYIDVLSHLLDSQNQLDSQYTFDGLHLNGQGYLVWKEVLEKYLVDQELQNRDVA